MFINIIYFLCLPILYVICLFSDICLIFFKPFIQIFKWFDDRALDDYIYSDKPNTNRGLLLLHGSGVNESVFAVSRMIIDNILNEKGVKCRVYSMDLHEWYIPNDEGIDDYAKKIDKKVNSIVGDGVDDLTIVGYSMGGLVASHYVENYCNLSDIIKCIYTIGTPWYGVPLLKYIGGLPFINSKRHLDMIPGSDFLTDLRDKVKNSNVVYKTIGSKWDVQVPRGYYSLDGVKNINTIYSHTTMIMAPSTWRYILDDVFDINK